MTRAERVVVEAALALGGGVPAFGELMRQAEAGWRLWLAGQGHPPGGEFAVGPCAGMLVSCQCATEAEPQLDENGHCEWCCGTRRVTQKVREAQGAPRIRFVRFADARDRVRELLATRPAEPTTEEMRRWWDSSWFVTELISDFEAWEKAGQDVVDLFDPMPQRATSASLVAVAQGAKEANRSLRADLDAARAEHRREQDARALLRVELDRTKAERDEAQMLCRDARIQAMDRGASYQATVAELADERAQHRANVEGFEAALAQEQHERSILEQSERDLRAELERVKPVYAASIALRLARSVVANAGHVGQAADDAEQSERRASDLWNDAVDAATEAERRRVAARAGIIVAGVDIDRRGEPVITVAEPQSAPAVRFFAARVRDCAPDTTASPAINEGYARDRAALLTDDPSKARGFCWVAATDLPWSAWCIVDAAPAEPCCPQATMPGGKHDIGCRGGGSVH